MNDTERKRIKPQLLKCAKENENKGTFTGYVIVSSVCRAAVERIEELEKENAELRTKYLQATDEGTSFAHLKSLERENAELKELKKKKEEIEIMTNFCKTCKKMHTDQLTKATEIIKEVQGYIENNDDELYDKIEQFLKEIEK